MKKLLALMVTCALAVGMLSGCSGSAGDDNATTPVSAQDTESKEESQQEETKQEEKQEEKEAVTVTLWHMWPEDEEETKMHKRLLAWAEEFNASNTDNITVEVSGGKTNDVILTTIASGSTPDIFQNYWNNASTWADAGALYDLTDFVAAADDKYDWNTDDFVTNVWSLCTYNDSIYSIPFTYSSTFIFYRADLLKEAGWDNFPQTMEELAQCIRDCTILDDKGNITQMGMIPDYPWQDDVFWPVAFGAEYIDKGTNTITFDSEEIIAAYQFQADIYQEFGYDKVKDYQSGLGARATAEDPLLTGAVAMRWQADSGFAAFDEYGTDVDWAVATVPGGRGMFTGGVFEVNANTENIDATLTVLASLTSEETMKMFSEGEHGKGAFYARTSALENVRDVLGVSTSAKEIADLLLNSELHCFPMSSYLNQYLGIIASEMSEAIAGDITVPEACRKVVDQVQPLADAAAE